MHVDLGLNSAHSKISSYFIVKFFKSNREYVIRFADVEMGGISFGGADNEASWKRIRL